MRMMQKCTASTLTIRTSPDLQEALNRLCIWADSWQLRLAIPKCLAHKITNKTYSLAAYSYQLYNNNLSWSANTRDLGVIIDDRLTFSDHIMSIVHKSNTRAYLIRKCFVSRDRDLLLKAFVTYVRPLLESCTVVWSPHHSGLINQIESVQRNFTKKIEGMSHTSYNDRLNVLGLDSLQVRRIKFDLIFCYKIIHSLIDLNCSEFLQLVCYPSRGHSYKLQKHYSSVDARKFYFSNRVVDYWNNLPEHIVSAPSLSSFKRRLSNILF